MLIIIVGQPCSGKSTIINDLIRRYSKKIEYNEKDPEKYEGGIPVLDSDWLRNWDLSRAFTPKSGKGEDLWTSLIITYLDFIHKGFPTIVISMLPSIYLKVKAEMDKIEGLQTEKIAVIQVLVSKEDMIARAKARNDREDWYKFKPEQMFEDQEKMFQELSEVTIFTIESKGLQSKTGRAVDDVLKDGDKHNRQYNWCICGKELMEYLDSYAGQSYGGEDIEEEVVEPKPETEPVVEATNDK